jgi:hypothetical protein
MSDDRPVMPTHDRSVVILLCDWARAAWRWFTQGGR